MLPLSLRRPQAGLRRTVLTPAESRQLPRASPRVRRVAFQGADVWATSLRWAAQPQRLASSAVKSPSPNPTKGGVTSLTLLMRRDEQAAHKLCAQSSAKGLAGLMKSRRPCGTCSQYQCRCKVSTRTHEGALFLVMPLPRYDGNGDQSPRTLDGLTYKR